MKFAIRYTCGLLHFMYNPRFTLICIVLFKTLFESNSTALGLSVRLSYFTGLRWRGFLVQDNYISVHYYITETIKITALAKGNNTMHLLIRLVIELSLTLF